MGPTLVAILTAALLLPGIVAAKAFYQASRTTEVEPAVPALSSASGIALVGLFSILVHLTYAALLQFVTALPPLIPLPAADPYRLFANTGLQASGLHTAFGLFLGLAWLCIVAVIGGFVGGKLVMRWGDRAIFYGPLANTIEAGDGDDRFIVAHVLTKLRHERRIIGYSGTVLSMFRDEDRFPSKLVLKDASIFYLDFDKSQPVRREQPGLIDWIALSSADWENVALQVFRLDDDDGSGVPATEAATGPVPAVA